MIKTKSVVKFITVTAVLFLFSTSLFATELSLGFNYDNYNEEGENTFGGSANITEFITDEISINATVENKKNNDYIAYCAAGFDSKIFDFLGGFLFDLRNGIFSPGIILNGDIRLFDFFTIGANTNFSFSTENIFENYITEIEAFLTFHCKNQDVSLIFDYASQTLLKEDNKKDLNIGGRLDVLALDENSPFKIGLFFGADVAKTTYDESSTINLNVGGRFIFDLEKFGFTIGAESRVVRIGEDQTHTPFAISATTRFSL